MAAAGPAQGPAAAPVLVDPGQLAIEARNSLQLPLPQVGVSPDGEHRNPGLVNFPVWFWVENGQPLTQRTTAGAVWAEVTATPVSTTWTSSTGRSKTCPGTGTAWARGKAEDAGCTFTYEESNADEVATVTVTWEVTWTSSLGDGGTLEPFDMDSEVPYPVYERHAIVVSDP